EATDEQEQRRRAFSAFRELLQRLADRRLLVLALDDLQWGDRDSALLLKALLRPPDPPPLLLLGCYRPEDPDRRPFFQECPDPAAQRTLRLEALTEPETRDLAKQLLSQRGWIDAEARSEACARASQGSPGFLEILAQHPPPDGGTVTFESVVAARVELLPEAA